MLLFIEMDIYWEVTEFDFVKSAVITIYRSDWSFNKWKCKRFHYNCNYFLSASERQLICVPSSSNSEQFVYVHIEEQVDLQWLSNVGIFTCGSLKAGKELKVGEAWCQVCDII